MSKNTQTKPKVVDEKDLTPGKYVLVKGNLEYSRLVTPIAGEDLDRENRRRAQNGMLAIDKPYTTLQLTNAEVLPNTPDGSLSLEEKFVDQQFWTYTPAANRPNDNAYRFTVTNKSPYPNNFYQASADNPKEGSQIFPERELAKGLSVILILKIVQYKVQARKGSVLQGIILQEPIRYYDGATEAMQSIGLNLHAAAQPAPQTLPAAPSQAPAAQPMPQTSFSTPSPAATAPMPGAAPEQNVPAAPSTPEGPWHCAHCGALVAADQAFCGQCGAKKDASGIGAPMGGGNPYAIPPVPANTPAQTNPPAGIRYDASANNRDY